MKKFISTLFFVSIVVLMTAQHFTNPTLAIQEFTESSGTMEANDLSTLQNMVLEGFLESKRFDPVQEESEANYLVSGQILRFLITEKSSDNGEIFYKASIQLSLKITDQETGGIVASQILSGTTKSSMASESGKVLGMLGVNDRSKTDYVSTMVGATTQEAAKDEVMKTMRKKLRKFIVKKFPFTAAFATVASVKGREAAEILILVGSSSGLVKGDKLKVLEFTTMEVNGESFVRKKPIGEVKIKHFEGDFALCIVKKGGLEIIKSLQKKATLKCEAH